MDIRDELALRLRIMDALRARTDASGGTITREELSPFAVEQGFSVRLVDASRGIWNPRHLAATLSVISDPQGNYGDRDEDGGLFRYSYRRGSIAGDNAKLRRALELELPIVLFRKIVPGLFMPVFPVYVVGDSPDDREFVFALDEALRLVSDPIHPNEMERRYAERMALQRLHQPEFRIRVMRAYEIQCTVCTLRRPELLDASHIVADRREGGDPVVSNGLSLCKIHHAAYDRNLLGISGDGEVQINGELLADVDGPMLEHGLKEMHGRAIVQPKRRSERPDPERLDRRHRAFLAASSASPPSARGLGRARSNDPERSRLR